VVKQRFTQWFNGRHRRRGTLWEDRFRSVLVEGKGQALRLGWGQSPQDNKPWLASWVPALEF
jgi:hypothetical protein